MRYDVPIVLNRKAGYKGIVAVVIIDLGARWMVVSKFTPRPLYLPVRTE